MNARKLAWECLLAWNDGNQFVTDYLQMQLREMANADSREKKLLQELVYGVVRHKNQIDFVLNQYLKHPLKNTSPKLQYMLRLTFYQLMFLERIPDYAVINEMVHLTKMLVGHKWAGLMNAVARNFLRNHKQYSWQELSSSARRWSLEYALPEWIWHLWSKENGEERAHQMAQASLQRPLLFVRHNPQKVSVQELEAHWQAQEVVFEKHEHGVYQLISAYLPELEALKLGWVIVQDLHASKVVPFMGIQNEDIVLDGCAAPGGKTSQMVQFVRHPGQIVAIEPVPKRASRLRENLKRWGLEEVQVEEAYLEKLNKSRQFDTILIDAPCSNLGVLARKVDAKWRIQSKDIRELVLVQQTLLAHAVQLLKPGGRLIYSTCTVSREENEQNMDVLRQQYPNMYLEKEYKHIPGDGLGDGGYIARLIKK